MTELAAALPVIVVLAYVVGYVRGWTHAEDQTRDTRGSQERLP